MESLICSCLLNVVCRVESLRETVTVSPLTATRAWRDSGHEGTGAFVLVLERRGWGPAQRAGPQPESQRGRRGTQDRTYGSGTIPCAPRGNFARVSSGMFRCSETSLGGRWLSQLDSETSS